MAARKYLLHIFAFIYKNLIKNIFFKIDAEKIHTKTVRLGEKLGENKRIINSISSVFRIKNKILEQKIAGINFQNPIGLAAGFDYEARLTQILPSIGFGFETVGTITNLPYEGNPKPMLGRLPKSQSLMVNKGFKNFGAKITSQKLSNLNFEIPIGISIGKSNLPQIDTQQKSIDDIIKAFIIFEEAKVQHSYYELNISCPNLHGNVSFYPSKNLKELLKEVDALRIKRPIFVKMPLEKTDDEILELLDVISKYSPKGVILSNLSKNRKNKFLNPIEVKKFPKDVGSFSGKPTFERSNELIKLAYGNFKNRFVIIGCGGVFTGKDAYEKILNGASFVQLITGMVFNGPQLISQINLELIDLLKRDRFTSLEETVGKNS